MKTILVAALLFWVCDAFGASWGVFTANSYHFNRERTYNETNHGLGYEQDISNRWKIQVGYYQNSFSRTSVYAGGTYLPWQWRDFRFGGTIAAVSGYNSKPTIIAFPTIQWEGETFGTNIMVLPSVVGIQFKWKFK